MNRAVPTINTSRVTLRAMRAQDFERYAAIWGDPVAVEHVLSAPRSRDSAWGAFLRSVGHWQVAGFGEWAVEDHKRKRMIGQAGFFFGARGLGPDFDVYPEVGWLIEPESRGQGFGYHAAQAAHDWFDRVITGPIVARIASENAPALRLADRLGYHPLREADGANLLIRRSPP